MQHPALNAIHDNNENLNRCIEHFLASVLFLHNIATSLYINVDNMCSPAGSAGFGRSSRALDFQTLVEDFLTDLLEDLPSQYQMDKV